jgi:hypothetical protein
VIVVFLAFIYCTADGCQVESRRYEGNPYYCSMEAQYLAHEWIEANAPGARLAKWGCRMGRPA